MKQITMILLTVLTTFAFGELINVNPDPNGEPWIAGGWKMPDAEEMAKIDALPKLTLPERYKKSVKSLPYQLDNSQLMYFRPIFNQMGGSCAQASGVGYVYTYEMNSLNGTDASLPENQFPTHYTYNYLNEGSGEIGSTYFGGWDIINGGGIPTVAEYGGLWPSTDVNTMNVLWMDGFDKYKSGMGNRVVEVMTIPVGTPEGLETLKQYFNDYCDGSDHGGVVTFSAGVYETWMQSVLPVDTENEGQKVILKWHNEVNHAMTFVGYNDSIRWDLNYDGKYSNYDSEGNLLPMKEWEIGGLLMANSWGAGWSNTGGTAWVAYRTLAQTVDEGGIWTNSVYAIKVRDDFEPSLYAKATVSFSERNELKIYAGVSTDTTAAEPEHTLLFPHFNRQGGTYGMAGDGNILEFGLDISPLLSYVEPGVPAKFFLCVDHKEDGTASGRGNISSFSISDAAGNEFVSSETGVTILKNTTVHSGVYASFNFDSPSITDELLPEAVPGEFYSYALSVQNGSGPYSWDTIFEYQEIENTELYPTSSDSILSVTNDDDGYGKIDLPFSFPFYGELFDRIYVLTDGSIKFDEGFEYIRSEGDIMAYRTITPYGADLMTYPENGDGIFYTVTENSVTVRWVTSMWELPEVDLEFACTLYSDSRIEFFYGDNLTTGISWGSGISNGKSTDAVISSTSNLNDPSGLKTAFATNDYPYGIVLSEDGVLSGITNIPGNSWDINVRVTDDRSISALKTLTFTTASGIDDDFSAVVSDFELYQNYPNPFNPSTIISFNSGSGSNLSLKIFNSSGEVVDTVFENRKFEKGYHSVKWTAGSKFTSGTYFIGLKDGSGMSMIRKISLLK
ncbi:MAG: T9SS type A sorting domain-containing protein [Candidatus Delongbacteria bacterium]|nr:T9SS type A sorting domain-containing protein [Candidatus Delongbacteria bacterium]